MFFRILLRDLKRKKTMNVILLLFIILAAMFVASGINNVISVINGIDYYFDAADIKDYVIITMGDNSRGNIEKAVKGKSIVKSYSIEAGLFGGDNTVTDLNGEYLDTKNATVYQSVKNIGINYFLMNGEKLTEIPKGHVYVTGSFLEKNNLKAGDTIKITLHGVSLKLIIDGNVKDALLGSEFMGNTRFILNDEDIQKFYDDEEISAHYQGEIAYIETDNINELYQIVSDIPGIAFDGDRAMLKMCYVMDMVVAFIILVLSVCLIIVSFAVLKFSISFTICEELREIGVMKAIGLKDGTIRSLYIVKYLVLSFIGAVIGFVLSIPFGNLLLESVTKNMILGNDMGYLSNLAGAVFVVAVIIIFAYGCTRRVKKLAPMDTIRMGQTGERFSRKSVFRIGKCHVGNSIFLSVNDVASNPRRFLTIIISFFIFTLFVLVLVNTTTTLGSDSLVESFSTRSDLYMTDVTGAMENMSAGREGVIRDLDKRAQELTDNGMPARLCIEAQYKYSIEFEGKSYAAITCQQGINTTAKDYEYIEGLVPANKNEIAITRQISKMTGAKIGDTIIIDFGSEKLNCVVTAYFQTMNQLGEIIRLHDAAPTDFKYISGLMQYQINFMDSPDKQELDNRKEKIKEMYDNDKVMDAREYCNDCMGVLDTMKAVQQMLLIITFAVIILVTVLMEQSFLTDEKSQIAMLKAVGFKDCTVILWHTLRFAIIAFVSALLAGICSIPVTDICISPIFAMMGETDVKFVISPIQIFVIYPMVIFVVTVLTAGMVSLRTKSVKSSDTANIE